MERLEYIGRGFFVLSGLVVLWSQNTSFLFRVKRTARYRFGRNACVFRISVARAPYRPSIPSSSGTTGRVPTEGQAGHRVPLPIWTPPAHQSGASGRSQSLD